MSHIITLGITPAMIPGIRKAAEICEEYGEENLSIAHDDIRRVCAKKERSEADFDRSNMHGVRYHAGKEMASLLRSLIREGDAA